MKVMDDIKLGHVMGNNCRVGRGSRWLAVIGSTERHHVLMAFDVRLPG